MSHVDFKKWSLINVTNGKKLSLVSEGLYIQTHSVIVYANISSRVVGQELKNTLTIGTFSLKSGHGKPIPCSQNKA